MATKKKKAKKKAVKKAAVKKKSVGSKKKLGNVVVWFEIPVSDIHRAAKFYSKVLGYPFQIDEMGQSKGAMFPHAANNASGALIQSNENRPSNTGTMIYLDGGKDLAVPLSRVVDAGGKIIQEKLKIGEYGCMAIFEDTEGNHVALHSMK